MNTPTSSTTTIHNGADKQLLQTRSAASEVNGRVAEEQDLPQVQHAMLQAASDVMDFVTPPITPSKKRKFSGAFEGVNAVRTGTLAPTPSSQIEDVSTDAEDMKFNFIQKMLYNLRLIHEVALHVGMPPAARQYALDTFVDVQGIVSEWSGEYENLALAVVLNAWRAHGVLVKREKLVAAAVACRPDILTIVSIDHVDKTYARLMDEVLCERPSSTTEECVAVVAEALKLPNVDWAMITHVVRSAKLLGVGGTLQELVAAASILIASFNGKILTTEAVASAMEKTSVEVNPTELGATTNEMRAHTGAVIIGILDPF